MKSFTQSFSMFLLALTLILAQQADGQSILNPADSVYTYNASAPLGTPTNPNGPPLGTIGKWVRTKRMSWNTNEWKCYIYNGIPFRLHFPKSYNPTANDGKLYPLLVFFHGAGEAGPATDNEQSLANGGQFFTSSVDNGLFDGYILIQQAPTVYWDNSWITDAVGVINYMFPNNKVDPFRIATNGLSSGGQASWAMLLAYPNYIAAHVPMSAINLGDGTPSNIQLFKYTRIWDFQGGKDTSPDPNTAGIVTGEILAAGSNYRYTLYPTLGHGTWNTVWAEPNFWPFIDSSYSSNPWTLFGQTSFCPGVPIQATIGVAPTFNAYQWRQNGVIIPLASANSINITQLGTYDCRVLRGSIWSDWSHIPAVISVQTPTITPPISVSGLMSDAIPGADGNNFVNLQVPNNGYTGYTWEKVGSNTVVGTSQIFKATSPGQYIVSVTQKFGCSSVFSPPFTVINANGSNPPSSASGLLASPLSFTQVQLGWTRNPNPVHPEVAFEIYRSTNTGGPYTYLTQVPADTVQYVDHGLNPNTKYFYVVRAIDSTAAAAISNEANTITQSDKTPPTAPANLIVLSTTSSSVGLKWNSSTDNVAVANYFIFVNGAKSYSVPVGDTTFTVYSLVANQEYDFTIAAVDGSGNISNQSNQVSAPTINNGLVYNYYTTATSWSVLPNFGTLTPVSSGVMPNVSISNATQTTNFGYTWQGYITIPVAGTYTFATNSDDGSDLWFNSLTPTGTPTVNNDGLHGSQTRSSAALNLTPGVYPIFIEYFQAGGGSAMSVSWSSMALFGNTNLVPIANSYFARTFNAPGTPPARPTQISATPTSYYKVNLSWVDNSNNETGFEVYRSTSLSSPFNILTTTGPNVTGFTDSTAKASTTYFYMVQAINKYGGSGFDSLSTNGVAYNYYQFTGNWVHMPNFNTLTPVSTGILNNFSLSPSTTTTNFAFKFLGIINIPTLGSYTFFTTSDDGSNLYIGGFDSTHLVVKNDNQQGPTQKSGTLTLSPGRYPIYVTYFQQGGGFSLSVSYKGPGIAQQVIPDSAMYYKPSIATTFAMPAVPAAPSGLTAISAGSSKIKVAWTNNATTATGIQLYRSTNNGVSYVLSTTLAASTVAYVDSGLFSNATFYYKVNAFNAGGNSAYSNQANATTMDIPPVIAALANQQVRYGTSTVIPISATTVYSGPLSFTSYNLPSFAQLTSNGNTAANLTLNPVIANAGTYNSLAIVASDAFGGRDTVLFNLSVNNNYPPTLDSIANYTINEGDSVNIPVTGHDVNTADILNISVSNVPNNYILTAVSNGTAALLLHPSYAAAGVYSVNVMVNDNNGLSASRLFTLTVIKKDPAPKIYARVQYLVSLGAPWNNMTSTTTTNLLDQYGNTTNVGLAFLPSNWWEPYNGGANTGNNTGVFPDAVLQEYYYFGFFGGPANPSLVVSGLKPAQKYNLTIFASSDFNGVSNNGTTTYSAGSQTVGLAVQNNTQNTVVLDTLTAAADGTITITMGRLSTIPPGYLNAIVIQNYYNDGTAPVAPTGLVAQAVPGKGVNLTWNDVAYNETSYLVYRSPKDSASFALVATLPANTTSYSDSVLPGSTLYYYRVDAVNTVGASPYSNTASTITPDRIPKINAIPDAIVNNTQSIQVNVTAIDDPTDHLTLTAAGLPSFVTFIDNGNGTGVVTITPTPGLQGTYPGVTITATDLSDSSRSASFTINVIDSSISYTYLSFTNNPAANPAPWNSLNIPYLPFAGFNAANLLNQTGANTGITVTLTDAWDGLAAVGMKRRNGSDLYPEAISNNSIYSTNANNHRITVTGLNPAKLYNFQFYASYNTSQSALTDYTINGQNISLNGSQNSNKTAEINGVTPDNTGTVVINCVKDASAKYALLSALVIESYNPGNNTPKSPADLRVLDYSKSKSITLQWQDRAALETGYEVWRANDGGSYSLLATLPANSTTYVDGNLPANTTYDYTVRAVNGSIYSEYSVPVKGHTYENAVYVFLNRTWAPPYNFPSAAPPFNDLNWNYRSVGTVWNNFNDDNSLPTNVGMIEPVNWDEVDPFGASTGNNSGVFPDVAMDQGWLDFVGDSSYVTVTGLDQSKTYDFTLFGSCTDDDTQNSTSMYTINGKTSLLNAHLNTSGTLTMFGIVPDQNGNVNISVTAYDSSNSSFSLLGVMVIKGYTPSTNTLLPAPQIASTSPAMATVSQMTMDSQDSLSNDQPLSAFPNPFDQSFNLSIPANGNDHVIVQISDVVGRRIYTKEFENLVQGSNFFLIQPGSSVTVGIYFVKVIYTNKGRQKVFKVVKK